MAPRLFALACTLALTACSTGTGQAPAQTPTTSANVFGGCPFGVDGAQVLVEDTSDGVVMTFTSTTHVSELRERSRDAAMAYGPGEHRGLGHGGHHGEGGKHGLQAMQLPPVKANWEEINEGARIRLVPALADDLPALRSKAREGVMRMATRCR